MIEFTQGVSPVEFILTLTENVTVENPVYAFTFMHVLTKDTISFELTHDDDLSQFTDRYNAFEIDTTQFKHVGEWHYSVIEQQTGEILESGKMIILRSFNYNMYDSITSFRTYEG